MSQPNYNKAINFNGSIYAVAGGKIFRYKPPALPAKLMEAERGVK